MLPDWPRPLAGRAGAGEPEGVAEPFASLARPGVEEVHPVVVGDLLTPADGLAGHDHHPVPLPVLDRVWVTRVVQEGEAAVDGVANGLHGEGLSPLDDGLHDAGNIELEDLDNRF